MPPGRAPDSNEEVSMSPKSKTRKRTTVTKAKSNGFTAEEKAAMKERALELKAEARGKKAREEGEADVVARISKMEKSDRAMAKGVHAIVKETAPELTPRTWYGMPAYANEDGKVVCYFKDAGKFNSRYATFGFNDDANLDEGAMWPTSYALTELTPTEEKKIAKLVKKAVS
jgi:uncharacterized protein YdhG (YjbR/CyaY superfamily)